MKSAHVLFASLVATLLTACEPVDEPTGDAPSDHGMVSTTSGQMRGSTSNGVRVFKGVPFAQPPVGDLRWAPPQPISWDGVLEADTFAPACLQPLNDDGTPNGGGYAGPISEDCLYLNIWAPEDAENAPIMVFLFGGGGIVGAGNVATYHGDAFARDGVILVTINYRLGALGGFAHPSLTAATAPGEGHSNYHLLDAIAALEWVKANAEVLGGDPNNILLFGESAGATMTANLVTSPMAQGLFAKAIFESTGSLPTPGTPLERAEALGAQLATDLGLPGAEATADQLRALDTSGILRNRAYGRGSRTIIDGRVKEQSILESFADGNENDVLLMLGTNSDEGRLYGTQRVASYAQDGAPVWQYFFDYVANDSREANPNGAPHAHELPFVFDTLDTYARISEVTDEDRRAARLAHSCWVAFAKLDPGADEIACGDGFIWPARSANNNQVVAILRSEPELGVAAELRSPPNGAEPGPTSRDYDPT